MIMFGNFIQVTTWNQRAQVMSLQLDWESLSIGTNKRMLKCEISSFATKHYKNIRSRSKYFCLHSASFTGWNPTLSSHIKPTYYSNKFSSRILPMSEKIFPSKFALSIEAFPIELISLLIMCTSARQYS